VVERVLEYREVGTSLKQRAFSSGRRTAAQRSKSS
jgi:hypothetical protein